MRSQALKTDNTNQQPTKKGTEKKPKRETFLLKQVDPVQVENKYGLRDVPILKTPSVNIGLITTTTILLRPPHALSVQFCSQPQQFTSIDTLSNSRLRYVPFIEKSSQHCVTMLDSFRKTAITATQCYWCRHSFSSQAIGCPLSYFPSKVVKQCRSEITKETFELCQSISSRVRESLQQNEQKDFKVIENEYYSTDGAFCSFNCCMAFINDNCHKPLYERSRELLMRMYLKIFDTTDVKIEPAPSWRLLREYGGELGIDEFRNSLGRYMYIDHHYNVYELPSVHPVGQVFKKESVF